MPADPNADAPSDAPSNAASAAPRNASGPAPTAAPTPATAPAPPPVAVRELGRFAPWYAIALYTFAAATYLTALLFELFASRHTRIAETIGALLPTAAQASVANIAESLAWRSAVLLLIGTCLAALLVAGWTLRAAWLAHRRPTLVLLLSGAGVALLSVGIQQLGTTSCLAELARHLDQHSEPFRSHGLAGLLLAPKRIGEAIAGLVGLAMTAVLILPHRVTAAELTERARRLRLVLYVSAAMLTIGVLVTRRSYAWATSFCADPDKLAALVENGTQLAAAFYTLVLAVGYLPAAFVLSRLGRELASGAVGRGEAPTSDAWLAAHDLQETWRAQFVRLLSVAAPLVSAVAPQLALAEAG